MSERIHIRRFGDGPAVLLLHGAPSPTGDLLPIANRLSDRYRVLVPDLPGYGATPAFDPPTIERVTEALEAELGREGVTALHAIVGFSGGAYRALHLALRTDVSVERIIGLATLATLDDASRGSFQALAQMIEADPAVVTSAAMRAMVADRMLSSAWRESHSQDVDRVGSWLTLIQPHDLAAELRAFAQVPDLRPELSKLRARLALRVGELDAACPPALSREIAGLVPGARLDVVAGCGHALMIENTTATVEAIVQLVRAPA